MTTEDKWLTIDPGTRIWFPKQLVIKLAESMSHEIGHFHFVEIGGPNSGKIGHLSEMVDLQEHYTNQFTEEE